jgi:hypothetical protein
MDIPTVVPAMMIKEPKPYPNIIPVNHIGGVEGRNTIGKRDREITSTMANTGRPKDVASHRMIGKRTYKVRTD